MEKKTPYEIQTSTQALNLHCKVKIPYQFTFAVDLLFLGIMSAFLELTSIEG